MKQHWQELKPKVTIFGGDTALVASLSSFCDAPARDDIASFFAAHPLPGAARTLTQTIEQINNCIALREKQTPAVTPDCRASGDGAGSGAESAGPSGRYGLSGVAETAGRFPRSTRATAAPCRR